MDLFNSYYPKEDTYLNEKGLVYLFQACSKTLLKNSLQTIHFNLFQDTKGTRPSEQEIVKASEMMAKVVSDKEWTLPADMAIQKTKTQW